MTEPLSYADSGVDLDAADESVKRIRDLAAGASRPEVLGDIGGFGGMFRLDPARWRQPVLVSSSDGVGTKTEIARALGRYDTIGQDLVAMVLDDIVTTGAEPLFFNDYISIGKLDPARVADLVKGIAEACAACNCALVGGETAEHPGVLDEDAFDLAGFGVGVVERDRILGPNLVREGDALIAMASSGLHSNGFSLVRKIVEGMDLGAPVDGVTEPGQSLGELLLTPTALYTRACLALVEQVEVHALCHITGGGLPGNLPRVLPEGLEAAIFVRTWSLPNVFQWLQRIGPLVDNELWRTFNCGVGMAVAVPAAQAEAALEVLTETGHNAWTFGEVRMSSGAEQVALIG